MGALGLRSRNSSASDPVCIGCRRGFDHAMTPLGRRHMQPLIRKSSAPPARRTRVATCIGAAAFLLSTASYGQAAQAPTVGSRVPANEQQIPAPVNPDSLSCSDLKAELKTTGELSILSGPRGGWGDTFYGPAVPRCQFWQIPQFTYVRARDGLCGVGYICVDKYSVD